MPWWWAEAITPATCLWVTSLFGRRWNSGWTGSAAAARNLGSSVGRSATVSPSQRTVPSKSTSIVCTTGGVGGGGGLPTGMFSFPACVWIGIVMISMISSTSITSISGVVFMSTITSGSPSAPDPTFIAMNRFLWSLGAGEAARGRLGDEADLEDGGALAGGHHAADGFVAPGLVGADVHLRLRHHHRDLLQLLKEGLGVLQVLHAPEHVAVLVDRDDDVLGLGLRRDVALLGQLERNLLHDRRNRDEEDDEQDQHHVDERRGVDGGHDLLLVAFGLADGDRHGRLPCRGGGSGGDAPHVVAHDHHVQVGAEGSQLLHRDLVAAHEPVVAQHRGDRDREAEGGHDERLAHGAGDLVDRGLSRDADGGERVIDAPNRSEEADERRGRAHGREEREAVLQARGNVLDRALDRHRDPGV